MKLSKKHYPWLIGAGLVTAFFASRLYNLLAIPIFTDEAIYIRWAQQFVADSSQLFITLNDGKQPLFIWLCWPFLKIIHDPLLATRLVSVLAGLFTMAGIYLLTKELFKDKKIAVLAAGIYVVSPFALVYGRLALYDSLVATFAVWSVYLEVLLVRHRRLSTALLSIPVLGAAMLTKSSAFFFLYLIPFSLLLFDVKPSQQLKAFAKWLLLVVLVSAGALACYSVLRLSPNYHHIADKNYMFIDPVKVWAKHPFARLPGNLLIMSEALVSYLTVPFLFLVALAFTIEKRFLGEKTLLFIWFIVPFVALALFGNPQFLYPRYLLFMIMPLIILASLGVDRLLKIIKPNYLAILLILVVFLPIVHKDYYILTDFSKAAVANADHRQLIAGYASGVGVKETVDFLKNQSRDKKIYVGTQGQFGLMPEGLIDYLHDNHNVTIVGYWPITYVPPQALTDAAKVMPTYFVFYAACPICEQTGVAPKSWPLTPVLQFKKLQDGAYYTLYQVIPQQQD